MGLKNEGIGCKFYFEMLDVHHESTQATREAFRVDVYMLALCSSTVPVH
jgi:hypothetical protein